MSPAKLVFPSPSHSDPDFHYLDLFLRPSITTIFVKLPLDPPVSLLSTLALKCPKLTNVEIESKLGLSNSDLGPEAQAVSLFVCELKYVEQLVVQLLNQSALQHISQLESLRLWPHFPWHCLSRRLTTPHLHWSARSGTLLSRYGVCNPIPTVDLPD